MIRTALEFIRKELESYMVMREQDQNYTAGNVVDLKSIVLPNGSINITDTTHVTVMLVGIDEERREGKRPCYIPTDDKQFFRLNPPVELDLLVLFVAHNKDYQTALRDLSDVAGFFQSNSVFDSSKYPSLNASVSNPDEKPWQMIDRLSFMLHSLTFEQQNNLWAMLGSKYIPSLVYRVKMLTIFETKSNEKLAAIEELNFLGSSQ
ncbi:MAG: DUF4255 domain-containing protein [Chlorobiaceae bacterium]|nr:DUF4255 domain-containing protein [Chlorobiaceae bacterium]